MRRLSVLALVFPLALPGVAHAVTPMDARAFADSVGVNTHVHYGNTVYGNYSLLKSKLLDLGVRHVRDGFAFDHPQWVYDRTNDLAAAGIKSTLISCRIVSGGWDGADIDVRDAKNKIRGAVEALEGTNEPDLKYAGWVSDTRGCQDQLYRLAKGDDYGAPLDVPIYEPSVTGDRYDELGTMLTGALDGRRADGGNMHPYPGNEKPSGPAHYSFVQGMAESRQFGFGGDATPVVATETGYHNALDHTGGHKPVSERASGIYLPRLYFEYAKAGVARTFAYELFDLRFDATMTNKQNHFGLYRNDGTAKPAANAIKNTLALVDSPSESVRVPLSYTLSNTGDPDGTGPRGAVQDLLLQKADGSWWLALWQDSSVWNTTSGGDIANAGTLVGVTLPRAMDVAIYEPGTGTAPLATATGRASFDTSVGDGVRLVKLTG